MDWLTDTSILMRTIHVGNPLQQSAIDALAKLRGLGETLCVLPQNLIEFWAVATRPITANGLVFQSKKPKMKLLKSNCILF